MRRPHFILPSLLLTCVAPNVLAENDTQASKKGGLIGTVAIDPAGFLLFGPTVSAELGTGRWSGAAMFRWLSPGLLGQELFLGDEDSFAMSYGISAHFRHYFQSDLRGVYLGVVAEVLRTRVDNEASLISTTSTYFVPQLDGGYRHMFGRFFVTGALSLGYAAQLSGSVDDLPGGTNARLFRAEDESSFYGSARLDLGVTF